MSKYVQYVQYHTNQRTYKMYNRNMVYPSKSKTGDPSLGDFSTYFSQRLSNKYAILDFRKNAKKLKSKHTEKSTKKYRERASCLFR